MALFLIDIGQGCVSAAAHSPFISCWRRGTLYIDCSNIPDSDYCCSWPSALLDHKAAAIGFALVKTGGAVGGFLGPFGVGALADAFHGYTAAMLMLAGVALAAGALVFAFRDRR